MARYRDIEQDSAPASASQTEIRLADYAPAEYYTETVDLSFDIQDGQTTVSSKLHIRRQGENRSEIYLHGQELELLSVTLDGRELSANEYVVDDQGMTIPNLADEHDIEIVTRIHPEQNTALEGLYKSSQMYCTQCEAEGFRKITYFQDRPDILARYTTTIIADDPENK